jgi:hypothetical protein
MPIHDLADMYLGTVFDSQYLDCIQIMPPGKYILPARRYIIKILTNPEKI